MAASTGGKSWRGEGRGGLEGSTAKSKGAEKPLVFLCHINICLYSLLFWVKKSPYTQSRIVHGDSSIEEVLRINETFALCDFMTIG